MAGSSIGAALGLGEVNSVRRTTILQGKREGDANEYSGNEFFIVAPSVIDEPKGDHDAIFAQGLRNGSGVIGHGGEENGTGVIGVGGIGKEDGEGKNSGLGVWALGGEGRQYGATIHTRPGYGLLAQGGFNAVVPLTPDDPPFKLRQGHGAGVVGVSGGAEVPRWKESAQVGVFGQGGDELSHTVPLEDPEATAVVGPGYPGVGVVGVGGGRSAKFGRDDEVVIPGGGAGVLGFAGGHRRPLIGEVPRDVGVVGCSSVPDTGRGGVFVTIDTPQLRLQPVPASLSVDGEPDVKGEPGDILVRKLNDAHGQTIAELWFCIKVNRWRKIVGGA